MYALLSSGMFHFLFADHGVSRVSETAESEAVNEAETSCSYQTPDWGLRPEGHAKGRLLPHPQPAPHEDGRRKVTGSAARGEEAGRLRVDTTEGVTRCVLINGTAVTRRVKAGTRAFPINPRDAPTQMLLLPSHT